MTPLAGVAQAVPVTGWEPFLQMGAAGIVLLILFLVVRTGDLRTRFEADAWERRAIRAEEQVDKLIPAVEHLVEQVKEMTTQLRLVIDREVRRQGER